jgi:hypothetical protein
MYKKKSIEIIISYYYARPLDRLIALLVSLSEFRDQITVVINGNLGDLTPLYAQGVRVISRENEGMNIGAWSRGFRERGEADLYIFLQDECFLKRHNFIQAIESVFRSNGSLGMVGESLNPRWAKPWELLESEGVNVYEVDHLINGIPSRRVDTYLHFMRSWGVEPGSSGVHLRSLVWAFPGEVMRALGGFPIGRNRGECIAAEIAVSRKVVMMGYQISQISDGAFTFFGHSEWRPDGFSKL